MARREDHGGDGGGPRPRDKAAGHEFFRFTRPARTKGRCDQSRRGAAAPEPDADADADAEGRDAAPDARRPDAGPGTRGAPARDGACDVPSDDGASVAAGLELRNRCNAAESRLARAEAALRTHRAAAARWNDERAAMERDSMNQLSEACAAAAATEKRLMGEIEKRDRRIAELNSMWSEEARQRTMLARKREIEKFI